MSYFRAITREILHREKMLSKSQLCTPTNHFRSLTFSRENAIKAISELFITSTTLSVKRTLKVMPGKVINRTKCLVIMTRLRFADQGLKISLLYTARQNGVCDEMEQ